MKMRERKVFFAARGVSTAVVGAVFGLSLAPPGPIGPCNVLILMHWENHNKDCQSCVCKKLMSSVILFSAKLTLCHMELVSALCLGNQSDL